MNYIERITELGLNIAYYRKRKKLTQEQLSEIVGVDRAYISRIEAPNVPTAPSIQLLMRIADALETTESKLFEFRR